MTPPFLNKLSDCTPARHLTVVVLAVVVACSGNASKESAAGDGREAKALPGALADDARRTAPAGGARSSTDSSGRRSADSAAAIAAVRETAAARRLSHAADSISPYLVFVPYEERVLVAAVRNRQLLVDAGRMDLDVRKDGARLRAFREAAAVLSPIPAGSIFRLHWAQGAEDVVADSFAVYNGRIVMRLFGSAALDSAARGKQAVVALSARADSAMPPVATTCELRSAPDSATLAKLAALTPTERNAQAAARKSTDSAYDARVKVVRDSLELELRTERPPYDRLQRRTKVASSQVRGCFGAARRALVVSLRAGDVEWVRERLVLVPPDGAVTPLHVGDLRFRAHDLLTAFDADGDGVDDLATRATTERAGGTTVLRVDLQKRRADRMAGGFAWEVF